MYIQTQDHVNYSEPTHTSTAWLAILGQQPYKSSNSISGSTAAILGLLLIHVYRSGSHLGQQPYPTNLALSLSNFVHSLQLATSTRMNAPELARLLIYNHVVPLYLTVEVYISLAYAQTYSFLQHRMYCCEAINSGSFSLTHAIRGGNEWVWA